MAQVSDGEILDASAKQCSLMIDSVLIIIIEEGISSKLLRGCGMSHARKKQGSNGAFVVKKGWRE
jgi:hypothetical protein